MQKDETMLLELITQDGITPTRKGPDEFASPCPALRRLAVRKFEPFTGLLMPPYLSPPYPTNPHPARPGRKNIRAF